MVMSLSGAGSTNVTQEPSARTSVLTDTDGFTTTGSFDFAKFGLNDSEKSGSNCFAVSQAKRCQWSVEVITRSLTLGKFAALGISGAQPHSANIPQSSANRIVPPNGRHSRVPLQRT